MVAHGGGMGTASHSPPASKHVAGIGVDLANADEIYDAMTRRGQEYLLSVFTLAELSHCFAQTDPVRNLASVLAAKGATIKALGASDGDPPQTSIEIQIDETGSWQLYLTGQAAELARQQGADGFALTIADDGERATATVVATRSSLHGL